jgi:hypothetical protein
MPTVIWGYYQSKHDELQIDDNIKVLVMTTAGVCQELKRKCSLKNNYQPAVELSKFIQVSAWVSKMRIIGDGMARAQINLDNGYIHWSFESTTSDEISLGSELVGIHLDYVIEPCVEVNNNLRVTNYALLVVEEVDGIYKRIGFGWVEALNVTKFDEFGDEVPHVLHTLSKRLLPLEKSWETITLG